jgi:hypothetical protein
MKRKLCGHCTALALLIVSSIAQAQEKPVSPSKLLALYNHWQDKQVTVAAYPALFMSPARWPSRLMELGAEPRPQTPALVVCETITPPHADRIASADLITVRGTFARRQAAPSGTDTHQILLKDCEVLSVGGAMPQDSYPSEPRDLPIPIAAFHTAVFEIVGKAVRIEGYYWGSTWSSASNQTRHDLQDNAEFLGERPVGCFQDGKIDAPQFVQDNRERAVIEGEITLTAFSRTDSVDIANCRFIQPE